MCEPARRARLTKRPSRQTRVEPDRLDVGDVVAQLGRDYAERLVEDRRAEASNCEREGQYAGEGGSEGAGNAPSMAPQ